MYLYLYLRYNSKVSSPTLPVPLSAVVVQREVSGAEHDVVLEGVSRRRGIAVEEISAVVVGPRRVDLVVVDVRVHVAFSLVFLIVHVTCRSTGTRVDGSHVVENPLAVLVNVVELHVVDVVLPRRLDDPVVLPVAAPARHVALHVDGREGGVGEVVVPHGHVVVPADPDAARRPEAAHRAAVEHVVVDGDVPLVVLKVAVAVVAVGEDHAVVAGVGEDGPGDVYILAALGGNSIGLKKFSDFLGAYLGAYLGAPWP